MGAGKIVRLGSLRDPFWEKQAGESFSAFEAFKVYRDQDPWDRSIRRAATTAHGGKQSMTWESRFLRWSAGNRWIERAEAWDREQDRIRQHKMRRSIEDMNKRHIGEALQLQKKAIDALGKLKPEELAPTELLSFIATAVKIERQAIGEPSEIMAVQNWRKEIKEAGLDPDELLDMLKQKFIDEAERGK